MAMFKNTVEMRMLIYTELSITYIIVLVHSCILRRNKLNGGIVMG